MAKSWNDVAQSDQFQSLSPEQQTAARDQYFNQVVAPKVPKEHLDDAKSQFDEASSKSLKEPGMLAAAGRAVKGAAEGAAHVIGSTLASGIEAEAGPSSMGAQISKATHLTTPEQEKTIESKLQSAEGKLAYKPKTEVGKDIANITDLPGKVAHSIGEYVTNKTGSKDLGTRAEAAANLGMMFAGPKGAKVAADSVVAGVNHINDIADAAIEKHGPNGLADIFEKMSEAPANQKGPAGAKMKAAADKLRTMTPDEARSQINNGNSAVHQAISAMRAQAGNATRSTKANLVETLESFYNITPGQGAGAIAKAVGKVPYDVAKAGVGGAVSGAVSGAKTGSGHILAKSMIDKAFPDLSDTQKTAATVVVQGALGHLVPAVGSAELVGGAIGAVWQGVKQAAAQLPKSVEKAKTDIKSSVNKVAVGKLLEGQPRKAQPTLKDAIEQHLASQNAPGASPSVSQKPQVPQQAQQPQAGGRPENVVDMNDSNLLKNTFMYNMGDISKKTGPHAEVIPFKGKESTADKIPGTNATKMHLEENVDGGYTAKFAGDNKAMIMFKPEGKGVNVSDVFRGNQAKGTAGDMVSRALKASGNETPEHIKISTISDTQPTLKQLDEGVKPQDTILGKTIVKAVNNLGGKITGWELGKDKKDKPFLKATISYD